MNITIENECCLCESIELTNDQCCEIIFDSTISKLYVISWAKFVIKNL